MLKRIDDEQFLKLQGSKCKFSNLLQCCYSINSAYKSQATLIKDGFENSNDERPTCVIRIRCLVYDLLSIDSLMEARSICYTTTPPATSSTTGTTTFFRKKIECTSAYVSSDRITNQRIQTLFWRDDWTGEGTFASRFAHLSILDNFALPETTDIWKSNLTIDGEFYVCNLKHMIDSKITCCASNPTIWIKSFPIKVTEFIWRACMDRIPPRWPLFIEVLVCIPTPTLCALMELNQAIIF
ncbi:hypothetical protein LXL04_006808 [Taraxacum kok-saghyz]